MSDYRVGDRLANESKKQIMVIYNVNDYREPSMKYAVDFYDLDGKPLNSDCLFIGDEAIDAGGWKLL